jgi:hypothetical protein
LLCPFSRRHDPVDRTCGLQHLTPDIVVTGRLAAVHEEEDGTLRLRDLLPAEQALCRTRHTLLLRAA